jgi:hypothetical protein
MLQMKKLIPMLLLTIISTNVLAEWTRVGGSPDGELSTYVDFATIRKKDNKVKIWVMNDLKTVNKLSGGEKYLSAANQAEYVCEEKTTRMLDVNWYSGNMGNGKVVEFNSNIKDEPRSISPGSIDEAFFKIACSIK